MLTDLKVSFLSSKCVFYRPELNAKGGPQGIELWTLQTTAMQKWNILTDRGQRIHEKNGVICLVVMFTPRETVINISQMVNFVYFLMVAAPPLILGGGPKNFRPK